MLGEQGEGPQETLIRTTPGGIESAMSRSSAWSPNHNATDRVGAGVPLWGLKVNDISTARQAEALAVRFVSILNLHYTTHDLLLSAPSWCVVLLKKSLTRENCIVSLQKQCANTDMLLRLRDYIAFWIGDHRLYFVAKRIIVLVFTTFLLVTPYKKCRSTYKPKRNVLRTAVTAAFVVIQSVENHFTCMIVYEMRCSANCLIHICHLKALST